MNPRYVFSPRNMAMIATLLMTTAVLAQTQQAGTLTIAGQSDQAPLVRMNGKSYIDIESLARVLHGSVRFQGSQTILTLPGAAGPTAAVSAPVKPQQLSPAYLAAQIETVAQIREWHAQLVKAVQNNAAVTDAWISPLRRTVDAKLQLAVAATNTDQDQQAAALLRNEVTAMQQLSDSFLALQVKNSYIEPTSFDNNAQDQKVENCQQALVSMAATKQFQDDAACH